MSKKYVSAEIAVSEREQMPKHNLRTENCYSFTWGGGGSRLFFIFLVSHESHLNNGPVDTVEKSRAGHFRAYNCYKYTCLTRALLTLMRNSYHLQNLRRTRFSG